MTDTIDPDVQQQLVTYLASRDRQRTEAVNRALATLKPFERRILREAAVMGYVRGAMAGRSRATMGEPRDGDVPADASIVHEVISCCASMGELYPYLAEATEGRRRRITAARRWPGEARR